MDWLDHEYLVPVFIGNGRKTFELAKKMYRDTHIRSHIFAPSFSFVQKVFYHCHKVSPMKPDLLALSLKSFAESIEEYYFPVIVCDDEAYEILKTNKEIIECYYLIVRSSSYLKEGGCVYDDYQRNN